MNSRALERERSKRVLNRIKERSHSERKERLKRGSARKERQGEAEERLGGTHERRG